MKFEQSALNETLINFADLDEIMQSEGFDCQWDYERITYDYKIVDEVRKETYYFRVPAHVHEGEIPKDSAKVRMMNPYVGKHYYPHGVEYDEVFPDRIVDKCMKKIESIREKIKEDAIG
ncbi:YugN family protein [Alkalicoccus chagannorensis]|uniref:YugN family protein n=1 Tax=Alkalicoccus chagannorensis TaxID=427072 RepID=UPI00041EE146|nr:YugN family protein [Alkalicoccus chagannorensis]